ncbi:MAG: hypothetical protein ACI90V_004091, partial [Bacillariaceae sp.]
KKNPILLQVFSLIDRIPLLFTGRSGDFRVSLNFFCRAKNYFL